MPPDACNNCQEETHGQWQPAPRMAFIRDKNDTKRFFNRSHVKFMHAIVWLVRAWMTLCQVCGLHGKSEEDTWKLIQEKSRHGSGLLLFSSAKWDILEKWYTVMQSFTDPMPAFVSPSCLKFLDRSGIAKHISLMDLFRFMLKTFDGEGAVHSMGVRHFLNVIMKKPQKWRDQHLQLSGAVWYLLPNQVLMQIFVNNAGELV